MKKMKKNTDVFQVTFTGVWLFIFHKTISVKEADNLVRYVIQCSKCKAPGTLDEKKSTKTNKVYKSKCERCGRKVTASLE